MAKLNFDANEVDPQRGFDPLPDGNYKVMVVDSDIKETIAGDGSYIWLQLEVVDGEYEGRRLWDQINNDNPNQTAVDIAERHLSSLCHATGELDLEDTEQFHEIPVMARVQYVPAGKIEKGPKKGQMRKEGNNISFYFPLDDDAGEAASTRPEKSSKKPTPRKSQKSSGTSRRSSTPPAKAAERSKPSWAKG